MRQSNGPDNVGPITSNQTAQVIAPPCQSNAASNGSFSVQQEHIRFLNVPDKDLTMSDIVRYVKYVLYPHPHKCNIDFNNGKLSGSVTPVQKVIYGMGYVNQEFESQTIQDTLGGMGRLYRTANLLGLGVPALTALHFVTESPAVALVGFLASGLLHLTSEAYSKQFETGIKKDIEEVIGLKQSRAKMLVGLLNVCAKIYGDPREWPGQKLYLTHINSLNPLNWFDPRNNVKALFGPAVKEMLTSLHAPGLQSEASGHQLANQTAWNDASNTLQKSLEASKGGFMRPANLMTVISYGGVLALIVPAAHTVWSLFR